MKVRSVMKMRLLGVLGVVLAALTVFGAPAASASAAFHPAGQAGVQRHFARPGDGHDGKHARLASSRSARLPGAHSMRLVNIPIRSLPAAQQDRLAANGISLSGSVFQIQSLDSAGSNPPYCVDAQSSGPLAGQNGDKVQLWHCKTSNNQNQLWGVGGQDVAGFSAFYNVAYPWECLNADDAGGLQAGRRVQLWDCSVGTDNMYWNASQYNFNPSEQEFQLAGGGGEFWLDALNAAPGEINNGDPLQIWTLNDHADELWNPING